MRAHRKMELFMTRKTHNSLKTAAWALFLTAPNWAHAHEGHLTASVSGLLDGLMHPFTGLDHLAAMLAVGVWSAIAVRPVWMAPLAFVTVLALGAMLGFVGVQVPAVEPMIAASLLVIGLLMAWRQRMPWAAAAAVAGVFALFHGAAHGMELAGEQAWPALAGMVVSTALLHAAGVVIGVRMDSRPWLQRSTGGALALMGSSWLLGLI
jgi:urease accessory protein